MTYCVSMLLDAGMVFLSDSRTNAGVDHINTFRKMSIFQRPGERVMVLMSSGNLAITQQLVSMLREAMSAQDGRENMWSVPNMFEAARHVGETLREVHVPLDLAIIKTDELKVSSHVSIDAKNEYFTMIRTRWSESLGHAFDELPNPDLLDVGERS